MTTYYMTLLLLIHTVQNYKYMSFANVMIYKSEIKYFEIFYNLMVSKLQFLQLEKFTFKLYLHRNGFTMIWLPLTTNETRTVPIQLNIG